MIQMLMDMSIKEYCAAFFASLFILCVATIAIDSFLKQCAYTYRQYILNHSDEHEYREDCV